MTTKLIIRNRRPQNLPIDVVVGRKSRRINLSVGGQAPITVIESQSSGIKNLVRKGYIALVETAPARAVVGEKQPKKKAKPSDDGSSENTKESS